MTSRKIAILDPEVKIELLIKYAFGLPIDWLVTEYNLSKNKIINLRKNNYMTYNAFFDHWKILKEVAVLGLPPKFERALSIVKKFYTNKIEIESESALFFMHKEIFKKDVLVMCDKILQKDNIIGFLSFEYDMKNYY
jgi:hypothetical protein